MLVSDYNPDVDSLTANEDATSMIAIANNRTKGQEVLGCDFFQGVKCRIERNRSLNVRLRISGASGLDLNIRSQ